MDTPVTPEPSVGLTIYGDGGESINRRLWITGAAALLLAGPAFAAARRIRKLWWRGTAHLEVGGRSLDIAAETSLELPLLRVRSSSHIIAQGPQSARTLILEPDGVWIEREGKRSPLPPQLGVHERQQYALYAWLLLVQQRKRPRPGRLPLHAPPYPDIVFDIGPDGYPLAAEWTVEADEPGQPPIPQRVVFTGRLDDHGIRWPARFELRQRGKPYFDLTITEFRAT